MEEKKHSVLKAGRKIPAFRIKLIGHPVEDEILGGKGLSGGTGEKLKGVAGREGEKGDEEETETAKTEG
jgi:hypothetical protein